MKLFCRGGARPAISGCFLLVSKFTGTFLSSLPSAPARSAFLPRPRRLSHHQNPILILGSFHLGGINEQLSQKFFPRRRRFHRRPLRLKHSAQRAYTTIDRRA